MLKLKLLFVIFFAYQACQPIGKEENVQSNEDKVTIAIDTTLPKMDTVFKRAAMDSSVSEQAKIKIDIVPSIFRVEAIEKDAVYRLVNGASYSINFGTPYKLEKFVNQKWEEIPFREGAIFTRSMKVLKPSEQIELTFGLAFLFDQELLQRGKYRMVKEVWKSGNNSKKTMLFTEFLIE